MAHKRKILTVVLLSAAGCGTTSAPSPQTRTAVTDVPVPVTAPHAATNAAAVASADVEPAPAPAVERPAPKPDSAQSEALIELRANLYRKGHDFAMSNPQGFRALCDAEGYPLVGNVAHKGAMYTVAEYCHDVRAKAEPRS